MAFIPASETAPKYDAIVVGSGAAGGMSAYVTDGGPFVSNP